MQSLQHLECIVCDKVCIYSHSSTVFPCTLPFYLILIAGSQPSEVRPARARVTKSGTKSGTKNGTRESPPRDATRDPTERGSSGGLGLCHLLGGGDSCTILGGTAMPTLTTTSNPSRTARHVREKGNDAVRGQSRGCCCPTGRSAATAASGMPAAKQRQASSGRPPMQAHPPDRPLRMMSLSGSR